MQNFKIAAQLYTLRDYTKTIDDLESTFEKLKHIGYEAVQVSGIGPIEAEDVKRLADDYDLSICATHISADRLRNDLPAVIKDHKLWNCKYVGLGMMPQEYRNDKDGLLRFIDEFNSIARIIYSEGLKFVYHNHKLEFAKYEGKTMMDILYDNTDPEAFEFELDTYWIQAGGSNPVDWIRKVDGRMGVVHFKDMIIRDDKQVFGEVGEGNLDWQEIIKACRETKVVWAPVEQDTCPGDPFESLKKSYNNLQRLMS